MPVGSSGQHGIFLSYSHLDRTRVMPLYTALKQRGARPILDAEDLAPGWKWSPQLLDFIGSSRAFGLFLSAASLVSTEVAKEKEYALQLFARGSINVIPIKLDDVPFPPDLSGNQAIDLTDGPATYERKLDRLIWSGITGKHLECVAITGEAHLTEPWQKLIDAGTQQGISIFPIADPGRAEHHINYLVNRSDVRVVVYVDLFEERPASGRQERVRYPAQMYADLILNLRRRAPAIRFVLYQQSNAWQMLRQELNSNTAATLQGFFTLDQDGPAAALPRLLRESWNNAQKDLLDKFEFA